MTETLFHLFLSVIICWGKTLQKNVVCCTKAGDLLHLDHLHTSGLLKTCILGGSVLLCPWDGGSVSVNKQEWLQLWGNLGNLRVEKAHVSTESSCWRLRKVLFKSVVLFYTERACCRSGVRLVVITSHPAVCGAPSKENLPTVSATFSTSS